MVCYRREALHGLQRPLEQVANGEGAEAVELTRSNARELLARLEPLIAELTNARSKLEESVRKQPLLAIALAAATGFLIASFDRR